MKQIPWLAFSIDRQSATPVFEQICAAFRHQAANGDLQEGSTVPPTRTLASELGVSRSTVVTAYEQLVAEGYLRGRSGSGYVVCRLGPVDLSEATNKEKIRIDIEPAEGPNPFEAGRADMRLFPYAQWAKTVSRVCRTHPQTMLTGSTLNGNADLCRAIADHVAEWRGIDASPHQIFITAGSGDAIELCYRALAQPGDRIGIENPGYEPLKNYALDLGLLPEFMSIDDNGAALNEAASRSRILVVTPSHQYPLGGAMTPNRRQEFLSWATRTDGWIIEDDYDSEFRYSGSPIPAMAGFDRLQRTIYVGSFSKIFSNNLRLGYVIVPEPLLSVFQATRQRLGIKASLMPQQALAEFISGGDFFRHLRRMRRIYGERRTFLLDRLSRDFSDFGWFKDHQAGMQVAFYLIPGRSDTDIFQKMKEENLVAEPLSSFCHGEMKINGLLLGFCAFSQEELDNALVRLLEALRTNPG